MTPDPDAPDETERVVVTAVGLFRDMYKIAMEERNAHREKLATALGVKLVGRSLEELVDLAIPQLRPKIGDEGCTCTLPPSYEGPCSWCDIHGQPSVAFEQGVAEGENSGRVFERELRVLRTKMVAMRADRCEALSAGLRVMARRKVRDRLRAAAELREVRADLASSRQTRQELADQLRITTSGAFRRAGEVARLTAELARARETIEVLSDTDLVRSIREGEAAMARGDVSTLEEFADELAELLHSTPADRGPLTPHPPPWPVSIDEVLTSPSVVENYDIPCVRCGFDRHHHTVGDGACQEFEEGA